MIPPHDFLHVPLFSFQDFVATATHTGLHLPLMASLVLDSVLMLNTSHSFPSSPPQTTFVSLVLPFHLLFSTGLGYAWAFSSLVNYILLHHREYFSIYLSMTGVPVSRAEDRHRPSWMLLTLCIVSAVFCLY